MTLPFTDQPGGEMRADAGSSDASLLRRFQAGEQDAATELYRRYAGRLLTLAANQTAAQMRTRVDAEDIVQSVFRTFFRRAALGEYELPDGDELWKLFLVIGLNKVRRVAAHHKALRRDVRTTVGDDALMGTAHTPETDDEALQILRLTIDEILAPYPDSYRQVVQLRIEGNEVGEIAASVGRSRRSVERILQEFRTKLRGLLHDLT
jgi:RNA polymerase sigma-70 factor (ECF subfamily)